MQVVVRTGWRQGYDLARLLPRRTILLSGALVSALFCVTTLAIAATNPVTPAKPAIVTKPTSTQPAPVKPAASKPGAAKPAAARPHAGRPNAARPNAARPKPKPGEIMELDWRDLLPENERSHYSPVAPPPIHGPLGEGGPPAQQVATGTVNTDLADATVRLPGFVVPISTPREGMVDEFFLVPYIGACIHVPPPPPNQMVYVKSATGIPVEAIHEAYWVTGKLRLESRSTPLGAAAYALQPEKIDLYTY